jgi:hypothetical protein
MSDARRRYTDDVPAAVETRLRELCLALPEVHEERAWVGTRWMVRRRTFAHVLGIEVAGAEVAGAEVDGAELDGAETSGVGHQVVLAFRSAGEELEALRHAGHPLLVLGWGRDALGMVLDDETDWDEVQEVLTESYCTLAPKKLVALVERPDDRS